MKPRTKSSTLRLDLLKGWKARGVFCVRFRCFNCLNCVNLKFRRKSEVGLTVKD